jgi:hypothetical protein
MASTQQYPQWEHDVLAGINAPASGTNLEALYGWTNSEGTASQNNPLAVSGKFPGATKCIAQCDGGSPVYAYDTEADGVAATVAFLKYPNYVSIVNAFTQNKGLKAIYDAIHNSKWCSGCGGGAYPGGLLTLIGGASPGAPGGVTGLSSPTQGQLPFSGSKPGAAPNPCTVGIKFGSLGQVKALSGAAAIVAGAGLFIFAVKVLVGGSLPNLPGLPSLPSRGPASDPAIDNAAKTADVQDNDASYQTEKRTYQGQRESVRRAGAPLTKAKRPRPVPIPF